MHPLQSQRIRAGARLFALLATGAPVLWYRDTTALLALVALAAIWGYASLAEVSHGRLITVTPAIEAALVGGVCGFAVGYSPAILVALAVPPFIAGLTAGIRPMLIALFAQFALVVGTAMLWWRQLSEDQSFATFTWCMAGLGLGLIGSFIHSVIRSEPDALAPYRDAQQLIRQLIDISDGLSLGLDVNALGGSILSSVRDELPAGALAIYVPHGEALSPLITKTTHGQRDLGSCEQLAVECWASSEVVAEDRAFAFPLGESAVVGGVLSDSAGLTEHDVLSAIGKVTLELQASAVHLDTAVLFSSFRDIASADERRRLAREMHDGVAQDVASLGYLVDALAARPASAAQAEQLNLLRDRITKVVREVRQSVLTLRTSIGESESLGAAIGSVARHQSEVSHTPIQVTLDEHSTRLRPEVEAELFRITQEAMNNAIKHAHASTIEVHCQVYAPDALITIRDDGRGLQKARRDSHGLKIMRERARLINADLSFGDNPGGGLTVTVQLATHRRASSRPSPQIGARVSS